MAARQPATNLGRRERGRGRRSCERVEVVWLPSPGQPATRPVKGSNVMYWNGAPPEKAALLTYQVRKLAVDAQRQDLSVHLTEVSEAVREGEEFSRAHEGLRGWGGAGRHVVVCQGYR